jgi:hypothetical protein
VLVSSEPPPVNYSESIASLGDGRSLIVWSQGSTTLARFVRGATPEGGAIAVASATLPHVAAIDGRYVIAMRTDRRLTFASVSNSGVATQNFLPPTTVPNDITNLNVMPIARGVLVVWTEGDAMRGMVVDAEGNVLAQPFTIGRGVPGMLPSSTFAPFIYADANVFTRNIDLLPAPPRIRVTRR